MIKLLYIFLFASIVACSTNTTSQQTEAFKEHDKRAPTQVNNTTSPVAPDPVSVPNQAKAAPPQAPVAPDPVSVPNQAKAAPSQAPVAPVPVSVPNQTNKKESKTSAKTTLNNWQINKDKAWQSSSSPVACGPLEELFHKFPINLSILTQFARPGRATTMGNEPIYIAHGALRADNTPHNQISVQFPAAGFSLYAANRRIENYIDSTEEQVKLEFIHPCGVLIRLDHLAQMTERWSNIIKDVPVTSNSRVTFFPQQTYFVTEGEVIANGIGHASNTYLDFGVYDLRQKNKIANYIAEDWPAYKGSADHGVCWPSLFNIEIESLLYSLPAGAVATSDFCD